MKLETLVFNFRKAIEVAKENNEQGEFFRKFPTGQCGNASNLLAQYLIDNGISSILYVNGTYYGENSYDSQSHAWLVVEGLIVDITAEQFKWKKAPLKCDASIYIGPMNDYYRIFDVNLGGRHEHFGLEKRWSNYRELKNWYKTILKYI